MFKFHYKYARIFNKAYSHCLHLEMRSQLSPNCLSVHRQLARDCSVPYKAWTQRRWTSLRFSSSQSWSRVSGDLHQEDLVPWSCHGAPQWPCRQQSWPVNLYREASTKEGQVREGNEEEVARRTHEERRWKGKYSKILTISVKLYTKRNSVLDVKLVFDTRVWLHVDTPFLWVQTVGLQRPLLTESLQLVNMLRTPVVPEHRNHADYNNFICYLIGRIKHKCTPDIS